MNEKLGISIIVCCYNSAKRIENTLNAIFRQMHTNHELIVVDNCSQDSTAKLVQEIFKRENLKNARLVQENTPGLSHARNKGISESTKPLMCFVDDDNELLDNYFELTSQIFSNTPQLGILGGQGFVPKHLNLPQWFEMVQENFAVGPQAEKVGELTKVEMVYGAGFTIRSEVWHKLKSVQFDTLLTGRKGKKLSSGEDTEICLATQMAGYDIGYHSDLKFIHHIPEERINWDYVTKLNFGFGQSKVIIDQYLNVLQGQVPNFKSKLPYWLDRYLYLRKASRAFRKTNDCTNRPGNFNHLKLAGQRGEMQKIWELKSRIPHLYQKVRTLKSKLETGSND